MYSPKIREDLISRLWRLAQRRRMPITRLVAEAVEECLVACRCALGNSHPSVAQPAAPVVQLHGRDEEQQQGQEDQVQALSPTSQQGVVHQVLAIGQRRAALAHAPARTLKLQVSSGLGPTPGAIYLHRPGQPTPRDLQRSQMPRTHTDHRPGLPNAPTTFPHPRRGADLSQQQLRGPHPGGRWVRQPRR